MDSKVEVTIGLVVTVWTGNIKNLVMYPFDMSFHVFFTGKGFVTSVTLDRDDRLLLWLVTAVLLEVALDVLGGFGAIGARGHSLFSVSPSDVPRQVRADPSCVWTVGTVLDCIFMYKTHMVGNILVHFSTYVTWFISLFVMSAVYVILQHMRVLEALCTCGTFLWLVSLHMCGKGCKSVQVHPTNAAHCPLVNLKLMLVQPFGMNR